MTDDLSRNPAASPAALCCREVVICPDWKNQTLVPSPDTGYLMPFINTKNVGPLVPEILLFRRYDPQKPLFDKTWKLPDAQTVG